MSRGPPRDPRCTFNADIMRESFSSLDLSSTCLIYDSGTRCQCAVVFANVVSLVWLDTWPVEWVYLDLWIMNESCHQMTQATSQEEKVKIVDMQQNVQCLASGSTLNLFLLSSCPGMAAPKPWKQKPGVMGVPPPRDLANGLFRDRLCSDAVARTI